MMVAPALHTLPCWVASCIMFLYVFELAAAATTTDANTNATTNATVSKLQAPQTAQTAQTTAAASAAANCTVDADVVVWGGTVCGMTASIAATWSRNVRVAWLVNGIRLGGMTSGGLGGRDGGKDILGGLAEDFWAPLGENFEPHTAEDRVREMLTTRASSPIDLRVDVGWVESVETVGRSPRRIISVTTATGVTACGRVFVDCSYEGDLVRLSGTEFAVGREGQDEYGESMAGQDYVDFDQKGEKPAFFDSEVSPFVADPPPSSPSTSNVSETRSKLLDSIVGVYDPSEGGRGDDWVMSYCYRMCLTNDPDNAVPIGAPDGYDPAHLELLRREIAAATRRGIKLSLRKMFLVRDLPNKKVDLNSGQWSTPRKEGGFQDGGGGSFPYLSPRFLGGKISGWWPWHRRDRGDGFFPFSTDLPFAQHGWPLGNSTTRRRIFEEHKYWTQAILYYLGNDPQLRLIQPKLVAEVKSYGLCGDEYVDSAHWTPQLYVRESVRLRGERVMAQADVCEAGKHNPTSVGLSRWQVDVHAVKRMAVRHPPESGDWVVVNTGGRDTGRTGDGCDVVVEVPYEAIVPKRNDTANLLVPVCASFTHIAFSTYRLEPQYAIFGQSAGTAAAMAIVGNGDKEANVGSGGGGNVNVSVHNVSVAELQRILISQGQVIYAKDINVEILPTMQHVAGAVLLCVLSVGGLLRGIRSSTTKKCLPQKNGIEHTELPRFA